MKDTDIPRTYWLDLDALDNNRATFHHYGNDQSLAGIWLDREQWEYMGRPSRLEITPKSA